MKVTILSDGLDGHINQSLGIVEILQDSLQLSYTTINVKLKNTFLRGLKYSYIKNLSKNLTDKNINTILSFFKEIDLKECDLLISTGGKLTVLNAALAKKYSIKNINNGSLRGVSDEYFSANLVLGENIKKKKTKISSNIPIILPPNRFNPFKHSVIKIKFCF